MNAENEPAIQTAVALLEAGDDPETVLRFIYHLGETEGMLKMSQVAEDEMMKLLP